MMITWLMAVVAVVAGGCLTDQSPINKKIQPAPLPAGALGTKENPVKCTDDLAVKDYIMRLRGPDGKRVRFQALGPVNAGKEQVVLEHYIVQSKDGKVSHEIYLNKNYPGHHETRPIEGFTIKKK
jgi:hypothetical protein